LPDKIKIESDKQAADRKEDHIEMALISGTPSEQADNRFSYEPILSGHYTDGLDLSSVICGKIIRFPIWISSMTGGTEKAKTINHNLAKLCGEFGLGMGLGSCRQLLYEDRRLSEFDVKGLMPDSPLLINLGIAQVEELVKKRELSVIEGLISKLSADGLIIHINPLQEWLQPEGDRIMTTPLETIKAVIAGANYPIIVKEVGQGFGKASLEALLQLPLEAIELAGFGGTNFSKLELMRSDEMRTVSLSPVLRLGHSCEEMLGHINAIVSSNNALKTKKIIFSGGIKGFLDGYYYMKSCKLPSIYAQASSFLKHALDYDELTRYAKLQIEGLQMSHALLRLKE